MGFDKPDLRLRHSLHRCRVYCRLLPTGRAAGGRILAKLHIALVVQVEDCYFINFLFLESAFPAEAIMKYSMYFSEK